MQAWAMAPGVETGMTVADLKRELATKPDWMIVCFDDGENGRTNVEAVTVQDDYYNPKIKVVVIGKHSPVV